MDAPQLHQQLAAVQQENIALKSQLAAADVKVATLESVVAMKMGATPDHTRAQMTVIDNSSHNNVDNSQHFTTIVIRNFHDENMDAVRPATLMSAFQRTDITDVIREAHHKAGFPENDNLRVIPDDRDHMQMYRKDKWQTVDTDTAITDLVISGTSKCRKYGSDERARLVGQGMSATTHLYLMSKLTPSTSLRDLRIQAFSLIKLKRQEAAAVAAKAKAPAAQAMVSSAQTIA
jgi:hypothetical protein